MGGFWSNGDPYSVREYKYLIRIERDDIGSYLRTVCSAISEAHKEAGFESRFTVSPDIERDRRDILTENVNDELITAKIFAEYGNWRRIILLYMFKADEDRYHLIVLNQVCPSW